MQSSQYLEIQGEKVPALGFGTWKVTGDDCYSAVRNALELGYRRIDTAREYENEEQVGEALADASVPRDDVFVTTKFWPFDWELSDVAEDLRKSTETSLRKLGLDYVDLLLIHKPADQLFPFDETYRGLSALKQQGTCRHVGISSFSASQTRAVLECGDIFANQVEYHPFLDREELRQLARDHDFMLTAWSPLDHGEVVVDDTLRAIGEAYDKSAAQVALRWLIQQENVAAIPKASSRPHRRENREIFDFELSSEEMARIDALERTLGEKVGRAAKRWLPW